MFVTPQPFSLSVNGVQCFKLTLQQLFVTSVYPTTHASHMLALIPCNTVHCGLVTVRSVQMKFSNCSLHVSGRSPIYVSKHWWSS